MRHLNVFLRIVLVPWRRTRAWTAGEKVTLQILFLDSSRSSGEELLVSRTSSIECNNEFDSCATPNTQDILRILPPQHDSCRQPVVCRVYSVVHKFSWSFMKPLRDCGFWHRFGAQLNRFVPVDNATGKKSSGHRFSFCSFIFFLILGFLSFPAIDSRNGS